MQSGKILSAFIFSHKVLLITSFFKSMCFHHQIINPKGRPTSPNLSHITAILWHLSVLHHSQKCNSKQLTIYDCDSIFQEKSSMYMLLLSSDISVMYNIFVHIMSQYRYLHVCVVSSSSKLPFCSLIFWIIVCTPYNKLPKLCLTLPVKNLFGQISVKRTTS